MAKERRGLDPTGAITAAQPQQPQEEQIAVAAIVEKTTPEIVVNGQRTPTPSASVSRNSNRSPSPCEMGSSKMGSFGKAGYK